MVKFFTNDNPSDEFFDEIKFRNLAIKLSNQSIANLRKELDEMRD